MKANHNGHFTFESITDGVRVQIKTVALVPSFLFDEVCTGSPVIITLLKSKQTSIRKIKNL